MNVFSDLVQQGQSVWYDNMSRALLDSGHIQSLVDAGEIRGITSNPTIFEQAIKDGIVYNAAMARVVQAQPDSSTFEIYEQLAVQDIRDGADALAAVYATSKGEDGYISVEVSPKLAHDADATIAEALRLHKAISRPNVMIKVPATEAGLKATRRLIAAGVSVNVTLIFSHKDWQDTARAYLEGLEQREAAGKDLSKVASVASFFISRIDTAVDQALPKDAKEQGLTAVAYAKCAYAQFQEFFARDRFLRLQAKGAQVQRLLWASTGTKNPGYSDLLYVESLIGPSTVNTMPPQTLDALRDHGRASRSIDADLDKARRVLENVAKQGVDMVKVTSQLKEAGVNSFIKSLDGLLEALEAKRSSL